MRHVFIKRTAFLTLMLCACLSSFGCSKIFSPEHQTDTAFERIIRTGVLRCGYIAASPYLIINPKDNSKSGISYEFVQAISEELGIKIEWTEETDWGNFSAGLNANRYDAVCTTVWESGSRARAALLTRPLYEDGMFAYAREDDNRFDSGTESLNKPWVKIADFDNDITQQTRKLSFPLAQDIAMPPMTGMGEYLLNVATHKADAVLVGYDTANSYNKNAKTRLKQIGKTPVRTFSDVLAIKHGEQDLKSAIDSVIHSLIMSGRAAEIVSKYPGQKLGH